jgi:hypothetical protein
VSAFSDEESQTPGKDHSLRAGPAPGDGHAPGGGRHQTAITR